MATPDAPNSRIAAARARAESAKTALLAAAVLAFFGAMAAERGAQHGATSGSSQPAGSSSEDSQDDDFGFFGNGGVAPSQGAPLTATGTS